MSKKTNSEPNSGPTRLAGRKIYRGILSGAKTTVKPARVTRFESEVILDKSPEKVFDFCLSEEGFSSIMPDRITFIDSAGEERTEGAIYLFRWWLRNAIPVIWVAEISKLEPGREFSDLQLRGFFRFFEHTHTCLPHEKGTKYRDTIEFASRFGSLIDRKVLLPQLKRTFKHRRRKMESLLTGGSS